MHDKIKVLFLAADPFGDGARREVEDQLRAIGHAIPRGRARDRLELVAHVDTGAGGLRDALLRHAPQVVHVVGRGDVPGVLYLGDAQGRRQAMGAEGLRGILRGSVRIVVLDGCDTLPLIEALSEVVDYTIGMNGGAGGASTLAFAQALYTALAMGRTALAAFELGITRLAMQGHPEARMPVRRIRRGVNLDDTLVPAPDARPGEGGA